MILRSRVRLAARALLLFAAMVAAACDSSTRPEPEAYALASINGAALPAVYDFGVGFTAFEVTDGSLTLRPDGTLTLTLAVRCRSPQPPDTECQVEGDGIDTVHGTYSRADGWIRLADTAPTGDVRWEAEYGAGLIRMTYSRPPSLGFAPAHTVFEFRR
jgi:hypothetical protein